VWLKSYKDFLVRELRPLYPYSFYHDHRFGLGDGMLLLSKHPILETEISAPFRPATRYREAFVNKRAHRALIDLGAFGSIDLFQTHLGSLFFDRKTKRCDPKTQARLFRQIEGLTEFVARPRLQAGPGRPLFLAGDLNFHHCAHFGDGPSESEEYLRVKARLRDRGLVLEDSYLRANGIPPGHPTPPTFSQKNRYVSVGEFAGWPEETLDYIFFRDHPRVEASSSRLVFDDFLHPEAHGLSDHYGLKSTFTIRRAGSDEASKPVDVAG
jgi:endonuclease/exonuclease/phosphatase family metal-dependent hydrolase